MLVFTLSLAVAGIRIDPAPTAGLPEPSTLRVEALPDHGSCLTPACWSCVLRRPPHNAIVQSRRVEGEVFIQTDNPDQYTVSVWLGTPDQLAAFGVDDPLALSSEWTWQTPRPRGKPSDARRGPFEATRTARVHGRPVDLEVTYRWDEGAGAVVGEAIVLEGGKSAFGACGVEAWVRDPDAVDGWTVLHRQVSGETPAGFTIRTESDTTYLFVIDSPRGPGNDMHVVRGGPWNDYPAPAFALSDLKQARAEGVVVLYNDDATEQLHAVLQPSAAFAVLSRPGRVEGARATSSLLPCRPDGDGLCIAYERPKRPRATPTPEPEPTPETVSTRRTRTPPTQAEMDRAQGAIRRLASAVRSLHDSGFRDRILRHIQEGASMSGSPGYFASENLPTLQELQGTLGSSQSALADLEGFLSARGCSTWGVASQRRTLARVRSDLGKAVELLKDVIYGRRAEPWARLSESYDLQGRVSQGLIDFETSTAAVEATASCVE